MHLFESQTLAFTPIPETLDLSARVEFVITRIMGHWPLHIVVLLLFSPVPLWLLLA